MKSLADLDHFNLDPAVKTQVAALIEHTRQEANRQFHSQATELQNQRELLSAKELTIN